MKSLLGNTRRTDITFYDNGRIDISSHVAKILNLQKGDVIDIMECENEYYIYVKFHAPIGRHESTCFPTKNRSHHFRAWSRRLCLAMIKICCNTSRKKLELSVGKVTKLWGSENALPIIYKNILNDDTGNEV